MNDFPGLWAWLQPEADGQPAESTSGGDGAEGAPAEGDSTAQGATTQTAAAGTKQPAAAAKKPPPDSPWGMALPLLAIGVLFYFLLLRPQRRDQKNRTDMIKALKKNDRVITVGGMYGIVVSVRPEADEVILKIDEKANTTGRFTLSSIARCLTDEPAAEPKESK